MGEAKGHYEKVGDIYEWRWDKGSEPTPFGGVTPEFDPTSAPDPMLEPEPEPAPKPAPKQAKKG